MILSDAMWPKSATLNVKNICNYFDMYSDNFLVIYAINVDFMFVLI